jgi:hypothetical protein
MLPAGQSQELHLTCNSTSETSDGKEWQDGPPEDEEEQSITVIDAFVEEGDTISWAWCTAHRDRQLTASFRIHFQPDTLQGDVPDEAAEAAEEDDGGSRSPENPFQRLSTVPHGARCVASRACGEYLVEECGRLVLFYDNNYPGSKDKAIFFAFYVAKSLEEIPRKVREAWSQLGQTHVVTAEEAEQATTTRVQKQQQPVIRCSSSPVLEACLLAAEDPALAGSYGYMLEDPNKNANANRRPSQVQYAIHYTLYTIHYTLYTILILWGPLRRSSASRLAVQPVVQLLGP